MRRRLTVFTTVALGGLLIPPLVNWLSALEGESLGSGGLYNVDFASRRANAVLYGAGISANPGEVMIGRDGWLFVGDNHAQTISVGRRPPTTDDLRRIAHIRAATDSWERYLSARGVQAFRILISPNKGTIYSEHLPDWARSEASSSTDALFKAMSGTRRYIDLRRPLLDAKKVRQEHLYYKTDSHWNFLGAAVAFRSLAQDIAETAPELEWPPEAAYQMSEVIPREGGDLANILRLSADLPDAEPRVRLLKVPLETVQYEYDTKRRLRAGGNPRVGSTFSPLLVVSETALNRKRVLWLRDSFGTEMSPFMAATFNEVLHLHYLEGLKSSGARLAQLVNDWKPDFVIVTVVERAATADLFAQAPPANLASGARPVHAIPPAVRASPATLSMRN